MESVNLKALTKTEIFARATEEEVSSMLNCLSAKKKKYQKDEIIFHAGDIVSSIGVMLKGNALIENDDIWGNRSVLDYVKEGQIFAETYACALDEKLMVNVIAMSDCEVLFLDVRKILKVCPNACEEPACDIGAEEPESVQTHLSHFIEDDPWQTIVLSVLSGNGA